MTASLFGLNNSNRDFSSKDAWGKNNFNSSFPAALACYMASCGIAPRYIVLNEALSFEHTSIPVATLFGTAYNDPHLFFSFETPFLPFQPFVIDRLPRIDLVLIDEPRALCLRGLEVKLTAVPDNSTADLTDDQYSAELVVRPDTIVYLALHLVASGALPRDVLCAIVAGDEFRADWSLPETVIGYWPAITTALRQIVQAGRPNQQPLILQPIWKTKGKSAVLADNAFDMFVWSDIAFAELMLQVASTELESGGRITRQTRAVIWLVKMIAEFCRSGRINHRLIIDELSYNTKNDKAFSINGKITHTYMNSAELTRPRVLGTAAREIILGGGHLLLSPERRLDAVLLSTPGVFV